MNEHNKGNINLRIGVYNFKSDLSLEQLAKIINDEVDKIVLETVKEHTKDEKWLYDIATYVDEGEGENPVPPNY